ncbi:MAG: hypothetical protein ACRD36_03770, partial [Candidatus Acidiferrum sp.]
AQIIIGGLLAYAYARDQELGTAASLVVGSGYMLSGKWLLHLLPAGHSVVIGLAWLPLVLLCFERALRRRSVGWAAMAGTACGLLLLGTHPQWTLYAGLFLIAWTLGTALEGARRWRDVAVGLFRWAGLGTLMGGIAIALAAIQFLPTLEAAQFSARHVLGVAHYDSNFTGLKSAIPAWLGLVGPSLWSHPNWENQSGIGIAWAMAAVAGACLGFRRLWPRLLALALVFAFALTGGLFLHDLPVLNLFRGAHRILLLTSLPLALLAGYATEFLPAAVADSRRRGILIFALIGTAAVSVAYTEFRIWLMSAEQRSIHFYWPMLALTIPALFALTISSAKWLERWRAPLWCAVLTVDLLALSWPFVRTHRIEYVFQPSPTLDFLISRRGDLGRVLDVHPQDSVSPFGIGAPVALYFGLYPVRGYNPLDFHRYKKYLRILSDSNEPHAPHEIVDGFAVRNREMLDLLGVRYLLQSTATLPEGDGWNIAFEDRELQVCFNYPGHGMTVLEPFTVYENERAMPRAFVVPAAKAMPAGQERQALLATDFHKTVLVEGCDPDAFPVGGEGGFRAAKIWSYQPNRINISVSG